MTDFLHMDGLACPTCGMPAERLGHTYELRGGEEIGFQHDTVFITRTPDGGYWRGNEPGVVALESGSESTSRGGAVVKTSKTVYALAVTHLCPKCLHVFPAQWGRPLRGDAS